MSHSFPALPTSTRNIFRRCIPLPALLLLGCTLGAAQEIGTAAQPTPPAPAPSKFLYIGKAPTTPELKIDPATGALSFNKSLSDIDTTDAWVDAANHFMFASSDVRGPRILVYTINQNTGDLTPVPGSPFPVDPADVYASLFIDPQGQFLYASGEDVNSLFYLTVFRINRSTGVPKETFRIPVPSSTRLGWVSTSLSGNYVYLGENNAIAAYKVDKTSGTISEISGSPFPAGPTNILAAAHGYLYAMNSDDTISGFRINPNTGALTQVPGSPVSSPRQQWMSVDQVHNFLLSTNANLIWTWRIDSATGRLTLAQKSGYGKLHSPDTILVDPSGKYAFVADYNQPHCVFDECTGAINSFRINGKTGKLSVVSSQLNYPGDPYDNNYWISVAR